MTTDIVTFLLIFLQKPHRLLGKPNINISMTLLYHNKKTNMHVQEEELLTVNYRTELLRHSLQLICIKYAVAKFISNNHLI